MSAKVELGIALHTSPPGGGGAQVRVFGATTIGNLRFEFEGGNRSDGVLEIEAKLGKPINLVDALYLIPELIGVPKPPLPDFSLVLSELSILFDTNATILITGGLSSGSLPWLTLPRLRWANRLAPIHDSQTLVADGPSAEVTIDLAKTEIGRILQIKPFHIVLDRTKLAVGIGKGSNDAPNAKPIPIPIGLRKSLPPAKPANAPESPRPSETPTQNGEPKPLFTIDGPLSLASVIDLVAPTAAGENIEGTWRDYVGNLFRIEHIGITPFASPKPGVKIELDASVKVGPWFSVAVRRASVTIVPEKLLFDNPEFRFGLEGAAMVLDIPGVVKALCGVLYEEREEPETKKRLRRITGVGQLNIVGKLNIGLLLDFGLHDQEFEGGFGFVFAKGFAIPIDGGFGVLTLTGLCGGFGYNRVLVLPNNAKSLGENAIVRLLQSAGDGIANDAATLLKRLEEFKKALEMRRDAWCIAFGATFSVVGVLDCLALLIVEVRNPGFEIALIGIADFPLGVGDAKLGHAQLALLAKFSSEEKSLGFFGALTSESWILDKNCKLQGGFAICMWFDGEHAGDFLVSLGGYSPFLPVKPHYPPLDRVGFTWNVSDEVTLAGGLYYTMDRYGIQFGGRGELRYTNPIVTIDARFSFDVLGQWIPAFVEAKLHINVNVEFRNILMLRLTLDVDMHVYGPPFGADMFVEIDLQVFKASFSVHVGESLEAAKKSQVPRESDILSLAKGKDRDSTQILCSGRPAKPAAEHRPLRADDLTLSVSTAIPAKAIYWREKSEKNRHSQSDDQIDVRPLNWTNVDSYVIWDLVDDQGREVNPQAWDVVPEMTRPVEALWFKAPPDKPRMESGRKAIKGFCLKPREKQYDGVKLENIKTGDLEKKSPVTIPFSKVNAETGTPPNMEDHRTLLDQLIDAGFDLVTRDSRQP